MLRILIKSLILALLSCCPALAGYGPSNVPTMAYYGPDKILMTKWYCDGATWTEIESGGGEPPAVEPFFEANWDGSGTTDERCATTPCPDTWDSLYDPNSAASIIDGAIVQNITSNTATSLLTLGNLAGQVIETFPDEYWYEYTVEFSRIDGFAANGYAPTSRTEHVSPAGIPSIDIKADASGVLNKVTVGAKSDTGTVYPLLNAAISPTANTPFTIRFHWKKATSGANGESHASVAGVVGSLTNIDSDTVAASKKISIGSLNSTLHNGTNNFTIKTDNFKLYTTDPGWTW